MKGLQIAVILLVLSISTLEALVCNSCVTINGACNSVDESCEDSSEVCANVTITSPAFDLSRACMSAEEIAELSATDHCSVVSCSTDRCN